MKNTQLIKWFIAWAIAMILLVILSLPDERPAKIDTIGYGTTESAELYFKNVRSFYYRHKTEATGIFDVYRLENIFLDSVPTLPFAIYNNWRTNETFIRLDTAFLNAKAYQGVVVDSAGIQLDTIRFPEMTNESQYLFARDVYKVLVKQQKIGLAQRDEIIWFSESMNRSIKRTLTDYFTLLGKL